MEAEMEAEAGPRPEIDALQLMEEIATEVDGKVYRGYSGRGMFGAQCYGVACDDAINAVEAARRRGLGGARVDQLGRGYIAYWPHLEDEG